LIKIAASFLISAALSIAANPHRAKLAPEFESLDPQAQVKVIVQWKSNPSELTDGKIVRLGGLVGSRFSAIKASKGRLSAKDAADLALDASVKHISIDHPLHARLDNAAGAIGASAAWNAGLFGVGVGVAVIDSGMNFVPDLLRLAYVEDFVGGSGSYGEDRFGHGQHIAGIIGGNGSASICPTCSRTFKGIAPGVSLISLRVLDENGEGTDSAAIAAIERAIALKAIYNIR
jgi:serine protease AprX